MNSFAKYDVVKSEKLGRYAVASRDLRASETILSEGVFLLGPSDGALVCFDCHRPLLGKFVSCKGCAVAPVCPGEGCPEHLTKWHIQEECDVFAELKLGVGLNPMRMIQNVGSLMVLRALLKRTTDPKGWEDFLQLETHLDKRKDTDTWEYYNSSADFVQSLGLLDGDAASNRDLVQRISAAIDVNSFAVRGPPLPAIGCAEVLRGVYLKAALLAHDCVGNTHMAISDNNTLVCHASADIKKGEAIFNNYTDALKGTSLRQRHLLIGKYFSCSCRRCEDPTELGTYMSSIKCAQCKVGFVCETAKEQWRCIGCENEYDMSDVQHKVQCCADKLGVINKTDERELEEYIRNVSVILAPSHFLLLEAKQRLAGLIRDTINKDTRPTKRLIKRKIELCEELLTVLEKISPGISRTKVCGEDCVMYIAYKYSGGTLDEFTNIFTETITLYELHDAKVRLAKKLFDTREITGNAYMDELSAAEKHLKRSLEMLFIEPGNSPEGELCAKALEDYRTLRTTMGSVLDGIHAEGKTYVGDTEKEPHDTNEI